MQASGKYLCSSCSKKFNFEDVRYSKDGKDIVCVYCYNDKSKAFEKPAGYVDKPAITKTAPNIIKIICAECNYHFSLKRGSTPRCPYCGGNRLMEDNLTADKLLEEVSRLS